MPRLLKGTPRPVPAALAAVLLLALPAHADSLRCSMKFSLQGWSAFYETAQGQGTVTCSDGSSLPVLLNSKGGGLTVGKSSIDDGYGEFDGVHSINDVLGDYVAGNAHAGAVKSNGVAALTKGEVSLQLKGSGSGFDLGVDLNRFSLRRAESAPSSRPRSALPGLVLVLAALLFEALEVIPMQGWVDVLLK